MLIHECTECGDLSINRIAADDDSDSVIEVFHASDSLSPQVRAACQAQGITILDNPESVYAQLYGQSVIEYA